MSQNASTLDSLCGSSPALAALSAEQQSRLTTILDQYLRAQEQGAPLAKAELLAQHADLAATLKVYFRSLEDLHDLAAGCGGYRGETIEEANDEPEYGTA